MTEFNRMQAELIRLEHVGAKLPENDPAPVKPGKEDGVWITWEPVNGRKKITQDQCPARCKRTGRCYGKAWFTGKPGPFPGPECDKDRCSWKYRLEK